jgi:lysophospholipase L1-like esterase
MNCKLIIFDGDSFTYGVGASSEKFSYPYQCLKKLENTCISKIINAGTNGISGTDLISRAKSKIDTWCLPNESIYVIWEGINDLIKNISPEDAYSILEELCFGRKNAGYKIVILTILPWKGSEQDENNRQIFNQLIRDKYELYADVLCDVGGDASLLGKHGFQNNLNYYSDKIHLTDKGYSIIAYYVAESIRILIENWEN